MASGVRITHIASGAVGECREERSQVQNKKIAFERLTKTKKFQNWLRVKVAEIQSGETIEQKVERMMQPENIKIEVKTDGAWTTEN